MIGSGQPSKNILQHLNRRLSEEPSRISEAKQKGLKVIGYFCPYIPEELIIAAGMLPIRLAFGGNIEPATSGEDFLKPYNCPFARSCLGYQLIGNNDYHHLLDAVCMAQTCESIKLVQEYWENHFSIPVFTLGLPHTHDAFRSRPQALEYFKLELELLRKRLGHFAGRPIKNRDIRRSISLCNQIREKLRLLFEYPQKHSTPIEWYDSFRITQAGFLINRRDFLTELRIIERELAGKETVVDGDRQIRLMVIGSIIGIGDYKILDLVKEAGGNIVADGMCTGSLTSRKNVTIFGIMGNPIDALAERYLYNVPCPCMTDLDKRLNRTAQIVHAYNVDGVIYYSLRFCDTWRSEYQLMKDYLHKEIHIPSLLIESDYSPADIGTIRTKIEAFLEMIGGLTE